MTKVGTSANYYVWRSPDVPEDLERAVFYVTAGDFVHLVADVATLSRRSAGCGPSSASINFATTT